MTALMRAVVHRPVFVAVVYLIVLLFGVLAYGRLSIDILPEVQPPVLTVVTPFAGAGAPDVEAKVTEPLEDALGALSGLSEIQSTSRDHASIVTLVFDMGHDLSEAATDVRSTLEGVSLPDGVDDPRILKFDPGAIPAVVFAVTDPTGDVRLSQPQIRRHLVTPLERLPGVGAVVLSNAPEPVVRVDVDRQRLVASRLTMTELATILGASHANVPAGTVDVGQTQFAVRMPGEAETLDALRDRRIQRSPLDDGVIRLRDVATVTSALDDRTDLALIDGQPVVTGIVFKLGHANTVAVSRAVKEVLATTELPGGLRAYVAEDPSEFIEAMVGNLQQTVVVGGVLVFVVVLAFVRRWGPSLVVATTIPTSMVTTFMVLERFGYTLNAVTLMAMALAIGMVVDNGIVVLENIARRAETGESPAEAAVEGATEVAGALLASTTTTVVIFVPMSFASGVVGAMFGQLSYVMITTIASSLVVALTLTPMLAARAVRPTGATPTEEAPIDAATGAYLRGLDQALEAPRATLGVAGLLAVFTLVLVAWVPTDFLPRQDQGRANITIELPVGTALATTASVTRILAEGFRRDPDVRLVYEYAGVSRSARGAGRRTAQGSHVGRVKAFFTPKSARSRTDADIVRSVFASVGDQPEVVSRSVIYGEDNGLGITGKPIVVELVGAELAPLVEAARHVERDLRRVPGAVDVSSDLPQTRPEWRMVLSRDLAHRAGVPFAVAAGELRAALTGVTPLRFSGDDGPQDVVVRLAPDDRDGLSELGLVPVRARNGSLLPLADLTQPEEGEAPVEIRRLDGQRVVTVQAGVEGRALGDVTADVEAILATLPASGTVQARMGGTSADQAETFRDLAQLAILGLVLVYLVMAAQFESWLDPLVILLSVPFAVTGAFAALLVTGTTLSMTSFLGVIILIGVVVNNAIVLIDYVKQLQSEGLERLAAVRTAARRRMRPVLITTLTTTGGMIPLAVATGIGSELWTPMGRAAVGGLLISTVVTLLLVPVVYVLVDTARERVTAR